MALLTACLQVAWIIQLRVFRQNRHFLAFCSPSRSFLRGGVSRFLPLRAVLKPLVTKPSRIFSTVCLLQDNASAILLSLQFNPSASDFNKMCARRTFADNPLSFLITSSRIPRSSIESRTMYFLFMNQPPIPL